MPDVSRPRPRIHALEIGDPVERWEALGFAVVAGDAVVSVGGVRLRLGAAGEGITGWTLGGIDPVTSIDGLATTVAGDRTPPTATHPNGAVAVDHVVVVSPNFERTQAALAAAGIELRRIRDAGGFRQGFRRLGPAILELVEAPGAEPGPARFWGLVIAVADLHGLAARLGEHLGPIKPAVQPGRRIATLRGSAAVSMPVAFMDPEPDR